MAAKFEKMAEQFKKMSLKKIIYIVESSKTVTDKINHDHKKRYYLNYKNLASTPKPHST